MKMLRKLLKKLMNKKASLNIESEFLKMVYVFLELNNNFLNLMKDVWDHDRPPPPNRCCLFQINALYNEKIVLKALTPAYLKWIYYGESINAYFINYDLSRMSTPHYPKGAYQLGWPHHSMGKYQQRIHLLIR